MRGFIGVDPRDAVSFNVLQWSIIRRASGPVSITPLVLPQLPIKRKGLTHFTFSRYLVPQLCGYRGKALFLDSDMLCLADIAELFSFEFRGEAVAVVKSKERFEWPSLMLFNCEECRGLTRDYIDDTANNPATFAWAQEIAALPQEWNHCVGYDEPNPDAKLVHFTSGTPGFKERSFCEHASAWHAEKDSMNSQAAWLEIHGGSVHAEMVIAELREKVKRFQ